MLKKILDDSEITNETLRNSKTSPLLKTACHRYNNDAYTVFKEWLQLLTEDECIQVRQYLGFSMCYWVRKYPEIPCGISDEQIALIAIATHIAPTKGPEAIEDKELNFILDKFAIMPTVESLDELNTFLVYKAIKQQPPTDAPPADQPKEQLQQQIDVKPMLISAHNMGDYVRLYCGSKCVINSGEFNITNGSGTLEGFTGSRALVFYDCKYIEMKLTDVEVEIYRLTSLTDKQCLDIADILGVAKHISPEASIAQIRELLRTYHQRTFCVVGGNWVKVIDYLLRNSFDVFNLESFFNENNTTASGK